MCDCHDSNGLGDIWWTDKLSYFSSIDIGQPKLSIYVVMRE